MAIIGMRDVCWGFAEQPLLENLSFQLDKGERVCLVGRNGAGQSTLLKLLGGEMLPDSGEIRRWQGICVAAMEQDVPSEFDGTISDFVTQGLGERGQVLTEHSRITRTPETRDGPLLAKRRDDLQNMLEAAGGWEPLTRVENILLLTPDTRHLVPVDDPVWREA